MKGSAEIFNISGNSRKAVSHSKLSGLLRKVGIDKVTLEGRGATIDSHGTGQVEASRPLHVPYLILSNGCHQ